jgi:hypothetical protein
VLMGERLDSSQPAKSPAADVSNDKAKSLFANDLHNIDRSLDGSIGTAKETNHSKPASLFKGYQKLFLNLAILIARSWPKKVAMRANPRNETGVLALSAEAVFRPVRECLD